jgi:transposase
MLMVSGVVGGVDTHADVHVAAALDENGGLLGIESFPTDTAGYRSLLSWLLGFGPVIRVGVEGTGSYGVGLARHLHANGIVVVEVDRPNRQKRRKRGKSDPIDAEAAARAALCGEAHLCGVSPLKTGSGKTSDRHRLNYGGDRRANAALYRIVLTRMSSDDETRNYVRRRTVEGLSKRKIMRCLKRYVARRPRSEGSSPLRGW